MRTVGRALWVDDEAKIHLVTAGPGSGPAYVFLFMQVLSEALQAEGLAKAEADEFALSTVEGAAALARESGEDFEALRRSVTSKGGTTAKAIEVLEAHDLAGARSRAGLPRAQRRDEHAFRLKKKGGLGRPSDRRSQNARSRSPLGLWPRVCTQSGTCVSVSSSVSCTFCESNVRRARQLMPRAAQAM